MFKSSTPSQQHKSMSTSPTVKLVTISKRDLQGAPDTLLGSENVWIWILVSGKKKKSIPLSKNYAEYEQQFPRKKKPPMKIKEPKWKRRALPAKRSRGNTNPPRKLPMKGSLSQSNHFPSTVSVVNNTNPLTGLPISDKKRKPISRKHPNLPRNNRFSYESPWVRGFE